MDYENKAIAGATVKLLFSNISKIINTQGSVTFSSLAPACYNLAISFKGLETKHTSFTITDNNPLLLWPVVLKGNIN
jgi:hypothetical protein